MGSMMYDLSEFSLADMTRCGAELRKMGAGASSMEQVANKIVRFLYDHIVDEETGERRISLVRLFKTHPYEDLDSDLKRFAVDALGQEPEVPSTKCLTLLATAGEKEEWNSRLLSKHHKTIPLPSEEMVHAFPMISNLVGQFGLEVTEFLDPSPSMMLDIDQRTYNVFHVGDAVGSEFIVDQESFVIPMGIASTVGFGGMLPSGNLFAVIMFCKAPVDAVVASMFRTISLSAKLALLPFEDQVFDK